MSLARTIELGAIYDFAHRSYHLRFLELTYQSRKSGKMILKKEYLGPTLAILSSVRRIFLAAKSL